MTFREYWNLPERDDLAFYKVISLLSIAFLGIAFGILLVIFGSFLGIVLTIASTLLFFAFVRPFNIVFEQYKELTPLFIEVWEKFDEGTVDTYSSKMAGIWEHPSGIMFSCRNQHLDDNIADSLSELERNLLTKRMRNMLTQDDSKQKSNKQQKYINKLGETNE